MDSSARFSSSCMHTTHKNVGASTGPDSTAPPAAQNSGCTATFHTSTLGHAGCMARQNYCACCMSSSGMSYMDTSRPAGRLIHGKMTVTRACAQKAFNPDDAHLHGVLGNTLTREVDVDTLRLLDERHAAPLIGHHIPQMTAKTEIVASENNADH